MDVSSAHITKMGHFGTFWDMGAKTHNRETMKRGRRVEGFSDGQSDNIHMRAGGGGSTLHLSDMVGRVGGSGIFRRSLCGWKPQPLAAVGGGGILAVPVWIGSSESLPSVDPDRRKTPVSA
jgi:hypothetical protein